MPREHKAPPPYSCVIPVRKLSRSHPTRASFEIYALPDPQRTEFSHDTQRFYCAVVNQATGKRKYRRLSTTQVSSWTPYDDLGSHQYEQLATLT